MLSSTNLRRLRTEYFNWHTDDSDVTHPDDAPYFDILKQMTQLEQIEFFSSKVPYLDMIFPGFSRLTSLFLNTPFDAGMNLWFPKKEFLYTKITKQLARTMITVTIFETNKEIYWRWILVGCAAHWQISSQLRHLELYQANTVPVTAPLQHATNLTYLDISFHGAKNRIRHLTNLKTLVVSFDFAGTPIECKDLAFLNQLKSLKFHSWDEIDIDLLTVLPTLGQLDDLSLRLPIDEAQDRGMVVRKLKEISRMVNLTSLELSSTIQNEAEIEFSRLTNLKRLNPGISKDVTSLINLPNLEYLYFNHVPPSLELLGTLTALTTLTELEILYETTLQDNPLVDFVVETFPRCKRLTAVKIGRGGRVNTDLRSEWKRQKDLAAQKWNKINLPNLIVAYLQSDFSCDNSLRIKVVIVNNNITINIFFVGHTSGDIRFIRLTRVHQISGQ